MILFCHGNAEEQTLGSCLLIWVYIGLSPLPVTVTTKIITFLVGDPYKPSFATVTGRGDDPRYIGEYTTQLYGDYFINHEINHEIRIPIKINQDSMESKAVVFFHGSFVDFGCLAHVGPLGASPRLIHREQDVFIGS